MNPLEITILPSILYAEAGADVKVKVDKELKVLDPEDEKEALAIITDNTKEEK